VTRGRLVVISGPGGVGKDTVIEALRRQRPRLAYSVSHTTRPARDYERDGEHYYFVSADQFGELLQAGEMIEHARVNGYLYGTSRGPVMEALGEGRDVILKIDVQGAEQVRRSHPDALFIFISPPDMEELLRRRRGRGSESEAQIEARQRLADEEMRWAASYDHVIVNDRVERAAENILELLEGRGAERDAS